MKFSQLLTCLFSRESASKAVCREFALGATNIERKFWSHSEATVCALYSNGPEERKVELSASSLASSEYLETSTSPVADGFFSTERTEERTCIEDAQNQNSHCSKIAFFSPETWALTSSKSSALKRMTQCRACNAHMARFLIDRQ